MDRLKFSTKKLPLIIGHRGASSHAVENSLGGFALAADASHPAWCDGVELDVHAALDGTLVVHHDPMLASGAHIAATAADALGEVVLSDGSAIPTLTDALELLRGLEVFIEVKDLGATHDQQLLGVIQRNPQTSCHVHAFDHRIIARLRALAPTLPLGVLSVAYPVDPLEQVRAAGADTLWQEARSIDAQLVERCHRAGIAVIAWTVNSAADARRLAALGVDGLCSDSPEAMRTALRDLRG